jgi:hypothetical protein
VRPSAPVFLGWGGWLTALGVMRLLWSPSGIEPALLIGGGLFVIALGVLAWLHTRPAREVRFIPGSSPGSVLIAAGLAMALYGLTAGLWLVLVGAEVGAIGLAALIWELVAERRARGNRP